MPVVTSLKLSKTIGLDFRKSRGEHQINNIRPKVLKFRCFKAILNQFEWST